MFREKWCGRKPLDQEPCNDLYFRHLLLGELVDVGSYTHTGSKLDPEPDGLRILRALRNKAIVKVAVDGQMGMLRSVEVKNDGNARMIFLKVETMGLFRNSRDGDGLEVRKWNTTLEWQASETGRDEGNGFNHNNVLFVYKYK